MSLEELRFVNAFIGFCVPSGGDWPTPLARLAYAITGLEHEVDTFVNGAPCAPVPEMICSSGTAQHCILLEVKSGSVSDRQAKAYKTITATQLKIAGLAVDEIDVDLANVDVIYMAEEGNAHRLLADFGRAGVEFPLVVHGDSRFHLTEGAIAHEAVHQTFENGVIVNESAWPMHYVRCDRESSDGDMAALCMRGMVAQLIKFEYVDVENLASRTIDLWDQRGRDDKRNLRRRITGLLREAELTELSGEIIRDGNRPRWLRAKRKSYAPQSMDYLSGLIEQFVRRKQEDRPYKRDQPLLIPYEVDE